MKHSFVCLLLLVIFFFNCPSLGAQEVVFEKELKMKGSSLNFDSRASYPMVNQETKETVFLLQDKSDIQVISLDSNFKLKESFSIEKVKNPFTKILNYLAIGNTYTVFFSTERGDKLLMKRIHLDTKKVEDKEFELRKKGEMYLESAVVGDRLYVLFLDKVTSDLHYYMFSDSNLVKENTIPLSKYVFDEKGNSLYKTVKQSKYSPYTPYIKTELHITKIENTHPNTLEYASSLAKLYFSKDKLLITVNNSADATKLVQIDLLKDIASFESIPFSSVYCDPASTQQSNSFILDGILYQITACKEHLVYGMYDYTSKQLLKEYRINATADFTQKNTEYIQHNTDTNPNNMVVRTLSNTEQVLRKLQHLKIAIAPYKSPNNDIILTVGAYKERKKGGGPFLITMVDLSYAVFKSVFFKTVLEDSTFKHLAEAPTEVVFDRIKEYMDTTRHMYAKTSFWIGEDYYYAYYQRLEKKYYIIKFPS